MGSGRVNGQSRLVTWGRKRLPLKAQALSFISALVAPSTQVRGAGGLCLWLTHPGSWAGQSAFSSPPLGGQARRIRAASSSLPGRGRGLLHSWQTGTRHAGEAASGWQPGGPHRAPGLCPAAPVTIREHLPALGLPFPICTLRSLVKSVILNFDHTLKSAGEDFPGGAVVKNPPANAGDTGLSPGLGRSHVPWSN